jgi:hypothetical protein
MGIVLIVVAAIGWFGRYKPVALGAIESVNAAQLKGQDTTLVAVQFTLTNTSKKPLFIKSIVSDLKTGDQTYSDNAASAVDYERYFTALPELRQYSGTPLKLQDRINPGQQVHRSAIFGFQIPKAQFDARQSFAVKITPDDERSFELTENRSAPASK